MDYAAAASPTLRCDARGVMLRAMRVLGLLLVIACGGAPPTPPAPVPAQRVAPPPTEAHRDDVIAAQIGTRLVTVVEVDRAIDAEAQQLLAKVGDRALRAYLRQRERLHVLDAMIDEHLLLTAAAAAGVRVSDAEVEQFYELARADSGLATPEYEAALRAAGTTPAAYRAQLRDQLVIAHYVRDRGHNEAAFVARARLVRELRARARITIGLRAPVAPPNAPRLLDASALLARRDVEHVVGRELPDSTPQRLDNAQRSATFDSLHLRARPPYGESHDVAVRVWKAPRAELDATWAELRASLPRARVVDQVADTSFEASEAGLHGHAFVDRKAGVLVIVTCGALVCAAPADARAIAKLVHDRLDRLTASPPALR